MSASRTVFWLLVGAWLGFYMTIDHRLPAWTF